MNSTTIAAPIARQGPSSPWIESRGFDLAWFILSPLAGLALLLAYPAGGVALTIAAATLVGGPHYLASYSFFFWEDTAASRRERWVVHLVVPAGIVAIVALVAIYKVPAVIMFVIYFWNAWHVSRQSCGILSIYRHRGGYADEGHKRVTNAAIIGTGLCMALWNLEWYPAMNDLLSAPSPLFPRLLWAASAVFAAVSLAALAQSLLRRHRAGKSPTAPEWAFLATSLVLFHPYLWIRDADLATLGMLMGHFIQYLGIVWLVNRRKFGSGALSTPRWVAGVWREPRLLLAVFALSGAMFMLLQLNLTALTVALVLLHFYFDGVFWAFKRADVRKSLGPWLTGWRGPRAGAVADVESATRPAA